MVDELGEIISIDRVVSHSLTLSTFGLGVRGSNATDVARQTLAKSGICREVLSITRERPKFVFDSLLVKALTSSSLHTEGELM